MQGFGPTQGIHGNQRQKRSFDLPAIFLYRFRQYLPADISNWVWQPVATALNPKPRMIRFGPCGFGFGARGLG